MKQSIWSQSAEIPRRSPLHGDLSADAAVIGGGLAGILTAHYLNARGVRTVVLEAGRIGSGQTKNTTAKITSQHGLIYHRLIRQLGVEQARQYADANQNAVAEYRRLVEDMGIDCDFTEAPAYLYSTKDSEPLRQEMEAARTVGIEAYDTTDTGLPFPVAGALCFEHQAHFHPLKFLKAVAQPLEIYEQTRAESVDGAVVVTNRGRVEAKQIIFACHFPFVNMPGFYFMRMHQERSYVLALENAGPLSGMYLGIDQDGLSLRPQGNLLLLGGGNHRTGENSAGGRFETLRQAARRYWPDSSEAAAWSAQDCMTLDGIPYIGRFSSSTPNWYVATGFQKWGMTSSMVSALLIRDLIVGSSCRSAEVFSPRRFHPSASAITLMEEGVQAAKGLARKLYAPPRSSIDALPKGHGGVVEWDGGKVGVYKDGNGRAFIVSIRCPHLGCQLEWNPDERSWDCPCHGSRFDYHGNLIDGPAQGNLDHLAY